MTTSKSKGQHASPSNPYARFIPREEVSKVAAWNLETFESPEPAVPDLGGLRKPTLAERAAAELRAMPPKGAPVRPAQHDMGQAAKPVTPPPAAAKAKPAARRPIVGGVPGEEPPPPPEPTPEPPPEPTPPPVDVDKLVEEARQAAYQDGYRNGLAALESYKQTQAAQMAAFMSDQVGSVVSDLHQRLESLEQQLAGRIAGVALELARQVVRTELQQRPELVVDVAEEAMGTLLASARHVVLRLNPDDHALAQGQLSEILTARGVRVMPDPAITRGGCFVESDIASVDATVEARWDRAAASLGLSTPWNSGHQAPLVETRGEVIEDDDEMDAGTEEGDA